MIRIAAGVEYCGTGFRGWQQQQGQRTVQAVVEDSLSRIADHPVEIICAGRTDTGVHATHQVIHFDTTAQRTDYSWLLGTNSCLPDDVVLTWIKPVGTDFHSRYSALSRRYRYVILNRAVRPALIAPIVTHERRHLDTARMSLAAQDLLGEHDFSSYRAVSCQSRTPVRRILDISVKRHDELVVMEIEANAFLHHMVRNIAGVLMAIGTGRAEPGWALQVLHARDRTLGGVTAPPSGLALTGVRYPDHYGIPQPASPAGPGYLIRGSGIC